jgi:hypothetical protein
MTAAIDMTRNKLTGPINRRARRYAEFWAALHVVGEALEQAEQFAQKATDAERARASASAGGKRHWSSATPEEIRSAAKKAHRSLRVIAASAKKWEADLVSREWRS